MIASILSVDALVVVVFVELPLPAIPLLWFGVAAAFWVAVWASWGIEEMFSLPSEPHHDRVKHH
jgi:hypothetical protein